MTSTNSDVSIWSVESVIYEFKKSLPRRYFVIFSPGVVRIMSVLIEKLHNFGIVEEGAYPPRPPTS